MELFGSAQHQLSLVGDNSPLHELRVIAAVELHVSAAYLAQHFFQSGLFQKKSKQEGEEEGGR